MSQTPATPARPGSGAATRPRPNLITALAAKDPIRLWLGLMCIELLLYATMQRGFAYMGVKPLFPAEVAILLGGVCLAINPRWREVARSKTVWVLAALMFWCFVQTVPHFGRWGMMALRDAALYGYGLFAVLMMAAVIARPWAIDLLIARYQTFAKIFLIVMPILTFLQLVFGPARPHWPWVDIGIWDLKGGDTAVHLGGIAAMAIVGLIKLRGWVWHVLLAGLLFMIAGENRGGFLAFCVAFAIAMADRARAAWGWRVVGIGAAVLVALVLINPQLDIPGRTREVSVQQMMVNLASIFTEVDQGDLEGTKEWRFDWWGSIVDYTVYGEYFWTGKGFGINLATDDGFQAHDSDSLRSPHNGHLTFLARGGVPAFVLWVVLQASWFVAIFDAYWRSRRAGDRRWSGLFIAVLAYWVALMLNAAVDVFLEGPMGATWFWSVFGFGLAARWVFDRQRAAGRVGALYIHEPFGG